MTAVGRKLNNEPITTETYIDFYDIVKQMFWDREGNNQASQKQSLSLYIDLYNLMLFHKYYKTTAKLYSTVGCYNISYMYIILGYGFLQNTYFKDYSYVLLFFVVAGQVAFLHCCCSHIALYCFETYPWLYGVNGLLLVSA